MGNRERFGASLTDRIAAAEARTEANDGLVLTVAADYGGRWDILQATNALIAEGVRHIDERMLAEHLSMAYAPDHLFIRTGGEQRISNFLIWQLAYTELFFTDELWPDFNGQALEQAISSFQQRERRFGRTSEQLPVTQRRN